MMSAGRILADKKVRNYEYKFEYVPSNSVIVSDLDPIFQGQMF